MGEGFASAEAMELVGEPWTSLAAEARRLRSLGHGDLVTYSPKVFIPLTKLCRDVCGYCTFAQPPRRGERAYMSEDEVLAVARAGAKAGCREAAGRFVQEKQNFAKPPCRKDGFAGIYKVLRL